MHRYSVLILSFNEEHQISKTLNTARRISDDVILIDSFSTDRTCAIAKDYGANIFRNKFITQSHQIDWALNNIEFKYPWLLRLDCDESMEDEQIERLVSLNLSDYAGVALKRKIYYRGKWLRFGGQYKGSMVRLFKVSKYISSIQWMDEHIQVKGRILESSIFLNEINHDRMYSLTEWIHKHNLYSTREVISSLTLRSTSTGPDLNVPKSIKNKLRLKKYLFSSLGNWTNPTLLFVYRVVLQLGFLDGRKGIQYAFLQSFWYRYIINIKREQYFENARGKMEDAKKIALKEYEKMS